MGSIQWQHDESKDYMQCGMCALAFRIHCHPHASPARPHFEPRHVTPRSGWLFIRNESGFNCGKPESWTSRIVVCVTRTKSPPRESACCAISARWTPSERLEKEKKRHLITAQAATFCKRAPDWPARMQRGLWLAESVLLTEGGLPESRESWKQKKKKKIPASKRHHAPPRSGFGIITGKPFVVKLY